MGAPAAPFQLSIDLLRQLRISPITVFPQMKSPAFILELQSSSCFGCVWNWALRCTSPVLPLVLVQSPEVQDGHYYGLGIVLQAPFCTHGAFWKLE